LDEVQNTDHFAYSKIMSSFLKGRSSGKGTFEVSTQIYFAMNRCSQVLFLLMLPVFSLFAQSAIDVLAESYLQERPVGTEMSIGVIEADTIYRLGLRRTVTGVEYVDNQDAIFEIGSITKTFTAALIMQQVEQAKMALDQPIETYLPIAIPGNIHEQETVNVYHLLTHTSGLEKFPGSVSLPYLKGAIFSPKNPHRFVKARHYYRYLKKFSLDYTPGQSWDYNNSAYGLLGEMLAYQTNSPWEEVVQQNIFNPLGMKSSYFRVPKTELDRFIEGITIKGKRAKAWDMDFINPAGTIESTLNDMLRYASAQLKAPGEELSFLALTHDPLNYDIHMTGKLWAEHQRMGLGWWHSVEQPEQPFAWHGGSTGGYTSFVGFSQERNRAVVVLSNLASSHPQGRADENIPAAIRLGHRLMWLKD
jgi:CubicO group peptidase (beta-lactamase class C family)